MKKITQYQTNEYYSLKEKIADVEKHTNEKFEGQEKLNDTKFKHISEDTSKALAANDRRLDGMNEIKGAMKDQAAHFPTREEIEPRLRSLEKSVNNTISKDDYTGRHEQLLEAVKKLEISKASMDAKADQKEVDDKFKSLGVSTNWTRIFLIITVIISAAALLINIFKNH